ncbi:LuxR family transcriptional regulator [Amycolatopsis sp. DG1A-15b]|uniref:AAA family ATPase n=1 Tax=Amycolatopsis sp. DG1A-15b TaxID=3052846 RepID=UPI00255BAF09|nr:LuxR family transcriptional regulator [Amycolatopsis sp. DG1A-15b]WIX91380.1 AAA family ATPase [Amycolatopsis sp. DG1A-15b]
MSGREPELVGRGEELAALDGVLAAARAGRSRVLLLRGEAGIGKTALLDHVAARATGCRVARTAGVESEQELPYAGLQRLCVPFLGRLEHLPAPQLAALGTAFGLTAGDPPDRFLVGLAVLTLLGEVAEDRPLVCLVDDAQWLDRVSAQVVAFVARRLLAEPIALVVAVREPAEQLDLAGMPALAVRGLEGAAAGALLDSVLKGPLDGRVRDRIIAETHGNPLALVELPRFWTAAEHTDGLFRPDGDALADRLERCFLQQLAPLPASTRKLLLAAAAEPLGDATLLWRAAGELGLGADPATAAESTGLIEFGPRIRFRHPLVRSAVYRSASAGERQEVHRALAAVTDPALDPDRRAWHRAQASVAPDEDVAAELERSAGRAQARGGLGAAAALLDQAATLTPDPVLRARRELAAARAKRGAGALEAALGLLGAAEAGPPDSARDAEVERLRGQIAFDQRRGGDAAELLLRAAGRLDGDRARETYLEALGAAVWAGSGIEAAKQARAAPAAKAPPTVVDLVLDALATRLTDGYAAAAPLMNKAIDAVRTLDTAGENTGRLLWLLGNRAGGTLATEVLDYAAGRAFAERQVRLARDSGALVQLQFALNFLANHELLAGNLSAAQALVDEDRLLAEVTGGRPVGYSAILLAALRGRDASAEITAAASAAAERGQGRVVRFADYAQAVLANGLGRHEAARDAAYRVFEHDAVGHQALATAELAEAASRTGDSGLVTAALDRMSERATATPTVWNRALEARLRALAGITPGECYAESIALLAGTPLRVELARAHLVFGEWLRREGRRVDAREHLRTAHVMTSEMGLDAFADRARRELLATGETVRKRTAETATEELTPQEFQIARLAREGLSNPEIGTRLFLSPRTVEWHLRKVFGKLAISSRRQLRDAVFDGAAAPLDLVDR